MKLRFLAGMATAIARANGRNKMPRFQAAIGELIALVSVAEGIRAGAVEEGLRRAEAFARGDDGGVEQVMGVCRDVTAQKKAEEMLPAQATQLARSNRELEQFAFVASHDLQEPLRRIASYAQLLDRRYSTTLDDTARNYLSYMVDGVSRMGELIRSLLSYSRAGKPDLTIENVSTGGIVRELLVDLDELIRREGAVVTFDDLPSVPANHVLLSQVFQNLLVNAIKFHGTDAPRVHIMADHSEGEWLFRVQDNGIGIPTTYHQKIFRIFQRVRSPDGRPGTGIGLAICQRIIERHGGRIWVESAEGKGSIFFFTLPDRAPSPLVAADGGKPPAA
jgi:light-regulated signal transduction histidine kinase (bacteriophytochrome)